MDSWTVRAIGFVRSPFDEKAEVPRQAVAEGAAGIEGRIEMKAEHEHALDDLEGFDRLWILFWFHHAARPGGQATPSKVLPPRSDRKRGVFATRSPHRPNPIGMSAVRLVRIEGLVVHVRDLDLLDGTPVLDLKPYVPYADAFPDAATGWLGKESLADPREGWVVRFGELAATQLSWLAEHAPQLELRARIEATLALGPQPHPYRRIKKADGGALVLAVKEWRARFAVDEATRTIAVESMASGFRSKELATGTDASLPLHRAFVTRFG